ncbi:MAG: SPOR domain-containing protein [Flavobacteriales bacterium]
MQGFEEILIELLLRHNCVVVPSFGGFVAKQVSAQIDFEKGQISPPKKELLFNRFLLTDDGLFLAEYARRNGLFYEEAKSTLQTYTDQLLSALRAGEHVKIPKIGTFSREHDGQIRFEQDRFFNLLLSSYGLGNLSFVATQLEEQPSETPIIQLHSEAPERKPIKWARIAAAACFIPMAFYSVWIPTKTTALSSGLFSISDFNPFSKTGAPNYKKADLKLSPLAVAEVIESLELQKAPTAKYADYYWTSEVHFKVKLPKEKPQIQAIEQIVPVSAGFDIVVGCFSNEQNARNLLLKLQRDGFAARIIPGGTLIRVSAGNVQNSAELAALEQRVAARQLQGWIYKN